MADLEESLVRWHDGRKGFAEFAIETRDVWIRFARYLTRRWRLPFGVEEEDLVQELMVAAWQFAGRWDPSRGVSISRYVRYNAIDKAKKWLHQQRNSYRRDGSAPSRVPTVFTALERADDEPGSAQERLAWVDATQEAGIAAAELRQEMAEAFASISPRLPYRLREPLAAVAASGGCLDTAADTIIADRALCLALRVGSDDEAALVVRRSVQRALEMIAEEEQQESNGGPQ